MSTNFIRITNLILFLSIAEICHSQTNLPDTITSYGSKFDGVHFNFNVNSLVKIDSIVLEIDSLKTMNWDGPRELQIIIGNNYPDLYFGAFKKTSSYYKADSLKYGTMTSINLIESDSMGNFDFKFLRIGYNFQTANPYYMPGIWGRIRFHFANGSEFNAIVFDDRTEFTSSILRTKRKYFVTDRKYPFYDLTGRKTILLKNTGI